MNRNGPILIIEDDLDDQFLISSAFSELNYRNEIVFLSDGMEALEYLSHTDIEPFMVLSDINMPTLDGINLRKSIHINETLRLKYIPYVIFTTSNNQQHVLNAYLMSVNGYFVKPGSYDQLVKTISRIMEYWQDCELPNGDRSFTR